MKKNENKSASAALRKKAEALLKTKTDVASNFSPTEIDHLKLIHELEVHQVELEMQNEAFRQSERALKDQIQKNNDAFLFQGAILDSPSDIIIFALDKNYCYTEFTKSHKKTMFSIWDVEIKIGMNLLDVITVPGDRLNAKNNLDRALRGEHFLLTEEYGDPRIKRLFYENHYSPVKNSDDKIIGVSVFVIDVTDRNKLQLEMNERLKELNCHNHISDVMSNSNLSVDDVCEKIVHIIPQGFQFPDITGATIQIGDKVYQTGNFNKSHHLLRQEIIINDNAIGFLEVCLPDDKVPDANPLFLLEELNLLFSIAERLGNYVEKEEADRVSSESKEKYVKAFHASPYAIIISKVEDGVFLEVNDSFCSITGFTQEEALANTALSMDLWVDSDDRKRLIIKLRENGKIEGEEYLFRKKNGEILIGIFSASFIHLHNQSCIIAIINDVTASRQAEEKLRASEEKFRTITEQTGDLIAIADTNGIITYASQSSESLFLVSPEDMCGRNFLEFVDESDIDKALKELRNFTESRDKIKDSEFRLKRTDGSVFTGELSGSAFLTHTHSGVLVTIRDIDERKENETALKKLSQAVEQSPVMVCITDLTGIIEYANPKTLELTGYSLEELIGKNSNMLNSGEQSKNEYRILWETIKSGKQWNGEFHNKKKTGELFWSGASLTPMFDLSGKMTHYLSVQQDITERKVAEQEIRELTANLEIKVKERTAELKEAIENLEKDVEARRRSEQAVLESELKHTTMISNISDVIGIMGVDGVMKYKSPNIEKYFGWQPNDLIGTIGWLTVHPDDLERLQAELVDLLQTEASSKTVEYRYKCKDGSYKPIELTASNLVNNAVINGILLNYHDITERKRAEQALRDSEARFSLFMDYLPVIVFLKDHEGRTLFVNKYMEEVFGASTWVGKTMLEVFSNEFGEKLMADDINSLQLGYQKFEESLFQLDKKLHHYETQKFTIDRSGQEPWLGGISVDITGRKHAEEEVIKSRDEAEKANHAKSEFLSRMSHELRTPMNSIIGFAQLLNMGELNPKQKKSVNHILNSGKHLLELIDEVLEISRIEAGRLVLFPERVQLSGIIAEMLDTVQPLADARQLTLEFENSPDNQLFVISDRKLLKQVLINLLNNAVKYNREGGAILVKTESMPPNDAGEVFIRVSVTDTGLGIHPDDIPKLFVPFERIGSEKTKTEGTGLGLAVVKKIIAAMEGVVGVESIVDEGSTFWIDLPTTGIEMSRENHQENNGILTDNLDIANKEIAFQNEEKAKRAAELFMLKKKYSRETGTTVHAKTGTILYIEDNVQNAELVEDIFRDHRPEFHLIISGLGEPAVKLAIEHKPDLILLDLDLPDLDGATVMKNLLADIKTKAIPVVIITADATPRQIEKLMTAGARDYLTKPLDVNLFLQVVGDWIGVRK